MNFKINLKLMYKHLNFYLFQNVNLDLKSNSIIYISIKKLKVFRL